MRGHRDVLSSAYARGDRFFERPDRAHKRLGSIVSKRRQFWKIRGRNEYAPSSCSNSIGNYIHNYPGLPRTADLKPDSARGRSPAAGAQGCHHKVPTYEGPLPTRPRTRAVRQRSGCRSSGSYDGREIACVESIPMSIEGGSPFVEVCFSFRVPASPRVCSRCRREQCHDNQCDGVSLHSEPPA